MVVLADLHPGRSIVRDDQRVRAEQMAKRNAGTNKTDGISLANLMGRETEARKHEDDEEAESEGRRGEYAEEDEDGSKGHFQTPDDELDKLENMMPTLCDKNTCKTHYQTISEILAVVQIPSPEPFPGSGTVDPQPPHLPEDPEKICCKPDKVIDLKILLRILVEIGQAEQNVWKQACDTEETWKTAMKGLTSLDTSTPEAYKQPTEGGGGASPYPAPEPFPESVGDGVGDPTFEAGSDADPQGDGLERENFDDDFLPDPNGVDEDGTDAVGADTGAGGGEQGQLQGVGGGEDDDENYDDQNLS